jgi:hypothetical protein
MWRLSERGDDMVLRACDGTPPQDAPTESCLAASAIEVTAGAVCAHPAVMSLQKSGMALGGRSRHSDSRRHLPL